MLSFQNVTKTFRLTDTSSITPVNDVSFEIGSSELVIIIGRSGSGKTTLLNLAAGLVAPTSGILLIDGRNQARLTDREISNLRSRDLGFVFQFPSLLSALTVAENVALPLDFNPSDGNRRTSRVAEVLEEVGLADKLNMHPNQLSAGEQKRAVIARALINSPRIILADEPSSDLDQRNEEQIMSMIRHLNSTGVTFIVVTHNLKLLPFATTAYEMENGYLNRIKPDQEKLPEV